jgi:uncharacterized protein (TIGR02145 family)
MINTLSRFYRYLLSLSIGLWIINEGFAQSTRMLYTDGTLQYSILKPDKSIRKLPNGEKRFALIFGVSENCATCSNDASGLADAMLKADFTCMLVINNPNKVEMQQAINIARSFYLKEGYNIGLVYCSSHGFQMAGRQFFIPSDFEMWSADTDIETRYYILKENAISLPDLLRAVDSDSTRLVISISDACRTNASKNMNIAIVDAQLNIEKEELGGKNNLFYPSSSGTGTDMFSNEDNSFSWFTNLILRSLKEKPITIYELKDKIESKLNNKTVIIKPIGTSYFFNGKRVVFKLFHDNVCSTTITDIEGNSYLTAKIANQCWMAENLKTSHYNNGSVIPNVVEHKEWIQTGSGAWCNYDNLPSNDINFGKLYNWYAVNDPRGICPDGWRVPTAKEWKQLIDNQSISDFRQMTNAKSISNLLGSLGGGRYNNCCFKDIGKTGFWWSSTDGSNNGLWPSAKGCLLNSDASNAILEDLYKNAGASVRCIQD